MLRHLFLILTMVFFAGQAHAHASEQGFVLLLPTKLYIFGGVASVALTILLIFVMPPRIGRAIFRPLQLDMPIRRRYALITSTMSFALLILLLIVGLFGPHDPTRNLLPLSVWTVFWTAFIIVQGIFGNLWIWLNPWSGAYAVAQQFGRKPVKQFPAWLGYWPAFASFLAFAAVLLAHPAPADPHGLAGLVAGYWAIHFAGMLVFGPVWMHQGEGLTVLLENYARISLFGSRKNTLQFGISGWQVPLQETPGLSLAIFMIATLAIGSFDGLNETFWWFTQIGINPLEFPGRSAVIFDNLAGLGLAVPSLIAIYGVSVWIGNAMIGQPVGFLRSFCVFAPAILPIALAYHFAHYLPGFLVEIQYVARTVGSLLNLGSVTVTTGFFNTLATVKIIWLSQAGAVVAGHVIAILLSHVLALQLHGSHKKAIISQIPIAALMVAYTFFGLWLLASPRGG